MARKFIISVVAMIAIIAMVISGCTTPTPEPEPEPEPDRTTGPFLDEVLVTREPSGAAAIQQLSNDAIDVYAYGLADSSLYAEVLADPNLKTYSSVGSYNEFTFNPVGPTFPDTGKLNPFSVPEFREAMHWLVDRDYIVGDIMGGLAVPRFSCLDPMGADATQRFTTTMAALVAKYEPDAAKATTVITAQMELLGAVKEGGKWMYDGEPVEIIGLIRTEDERKDMGDYFAGLLEGQGFTVIHHYGTSRDLSPFWTGDPNRGVFHFYTGGWVSTVISRDDGDNFGAFYTNLWSAMGPLWQAYVSDPAFFAAAEGLWNYDYDSMAARAALFEICLPMSMEDNIRMFLVSRKSFSPLRSDVHLAADASGGIYGSWLWALTAHFVDDAGDPIVGGTMRIATTDILTNPWNPIAGTNWVYDMFPIRATGDEGTLPDTRTGLRWPDRMEKAEVVVETGLPVGVTNTAWCTLTFAPTIQVPLDAWADWDATTKKFLTVQQVHGASGTTALRKSISYYPKDIFEVPLHDGSTLSMGDFLMYTILTFDRGKPASAIYDEGYLPEFTSFMKVFKGVKFITDDPDYGLIVEYYSDTYALDAELAVTDMFPYYSQGPGVWHTIALGIRAEEDKDLAFGQTKATSLAVEWTSFIAGPSIPILKARLDSAIAANYIPYAPTMGLYVTQAEAAERWSNLSDWYGTYGHFWVASGPFFLKKAFTTEKVIHLLRFEDYPDPMDGWLFVLEPLS